MIIDNLNRIGAALDPNKADPPLVIYANAVLTNPIAFQGLKAVPRWCREITQFIRRMDLTEFTLRHALNVLGKALRKAAYKQGFRVPV